MRQQVKKHGMRPVREFLPTVETKKIRGVNFEIVEEPDGSFYIIEKNAKYPIIQMVGRGRFQM